MAILTKEAILDFEIADYVYYGGYSFIPGKVQPDYPDLDPIAEEFWKNKHGTIFTFNADGYAIEFLYDSDYTYIGDQIEFFFSLPTDKEAEIDVRVRPVCDFLNISNEYRVNFDEGYSDDHELVLFARSGANLHFNKITIKRMETYLLKKATSRNNNSDRIMIKTNMAPIALDKIRVIDLPERAAH